MIKLYTDLKKSKRDVLTNFREKLLISLKNTKRSDYPKFDGNIGFSVFENIYAPKSIGVYFIHDLRGILYIGRTNNIYQRFTQHSWVRKNRDLFKLSQNPMGKLKFSWVNAKTEKQAKVLEAKWIRIFMPICNDILFIK
tara:strand:- start:2896 stop:3312 length:417 start_codon:yes stop_codon:yes gene_type:complete